MRGHKYRIVNPVRFFIFILVCVLLITFTAVTIFRNNNAEASSVSTYMQVIVEQNDTLWDIAEDYCDTKTDIRDYVHEICEVNDISSNDPIQCGDVLFVPLH